jgi:PBSX family phage terminase large subunit
LEVIELQLPDKTITFNESQLKVFNALFNDDGTIKDSDIREISFFGAVRCGKSFLFQLIGWLLACRYPNARILWVRDTYGQLKDSVIKQFNDDFGRYGAFEYKKTEREAVFGNGSIIKFRAFDVDGLGILSSEYDMIVFCQAEDISIDWFLLALSRLSGRNLTRPLMFCEGNPANTWPKHRYKDQTPEQLKELGILFVEAETSDNQKNLPSDYIEFLKKNYPEAWFNRYVLGGWEQIDEMVFSEFREKDHVIPPHQVPATAKKRQGMDYGWRNPTAILWGYIDYDGILRIYATDGGSELTAPEIAKKALALGKQAIVCDYSIKRPDRDGRSLWDDLVKAGLWLQESNKQELANIQLANQLLKTGRLQIMSNCTELIKEMKNYKWKRLKVGKESNLPEETIDKDNHYIDALLYLIASLEELKIESPEQKAFKQTMQYAIIKKSNSNNNIMRFG